LGAKVYSGSCEAQTYDQLVSRIKSKLKEFDVNHLQAYMKDVKVNLRKIADNGV
jgi:hypothetical protein